MGLRSFSLLCDAVGDRYVTFRPGDSHWAKMADTAAYAKNICEFNMREIGFSLP